MSENASRDALSGRIGLFGRAIRPARSTTRGSEAEIAWKVAFGCFSLTGGKPNGECRLKVIAQRSKELGLDEDRIEELSKGQLVFMEGALEIPCHFCKLKKRNDTCEKNLILM